MGLRRWLWKGICIDLTGGNRYVESINFRIEKASVKDYQLFADIIQTVWEDMPQKEWFMADNADYTYQMLTSKKGIGYKAVQENSDKVVGVFMVVIPGMEKENMGYDIGLNEIELPLVAHMDSVAILPQYRGHKLQYHLMQTAEADLKVQGFRYLMCTVHPDNYYSRNNVLDQGYQSMAIKEKYSGHLREIFLKKLN